MSSGELGIGFTHVPGGQEYANTSVLSWHYYTPMPNPSIWGGRVCYFMFYMLF